MMAGPKRRSIFWEFGSSLTICRVAIVSARQFFIISAVMDHIFEHDLMQFTESSNHESTLHIFGGSEFVDPVDAGVASTAEVIEGSADDMQHFLDMNLCEHDFAGADNDDKRQQQQQPIAAQTAATDDNLQQVVGRSRWQRSARASNWHAAVI